MLIHGNLCKLGCRAIQYVSMTCFNDIFVVVPMTRQYHDNWLRIDLEIKEKVKSKEGVSIFADCERDLPLSARRSCLVLFD